MCCFVVCNVLFVVCNVLFVVCNVVYCCSVFCDIGTGVTDPKIGTLIQDSMSVTCVSNDLVNELSR